MTPLMHKNCSIIFFTHPPFCIFSPYVSVLLLIPFILLCLQGTDAYHNQVLKISCEDMEGNFASRKLICL